MQELWTTVKENAGFVLVCIVIIAALALVHGFVGRRQWGGQALVAFYVLLVLLGPSLMMLMLVLAFVDSWLDIRGRIKPAGPAE